MKKPDGSPTLTGHAAYKARLAAGETVSFRESGNSMRPRIRHRQKCTYAPVTSLSDIAVGDVVWCKVGGSHVTHLVSAIKGDGDRRQYQISNNSGHVNGWVGLGSIFGKVIAVED